MVSVNPCASRNVASDSAALLGSGSSIPSRLRLKPRSRFAVASVESSLRIGEIGRLQLQDMDFVKQRLFVRLPNKGNRERYAWFSEKTKKYYAEWMLERRLDCGHDGLLHNTRGGRCNTQQLGLAFSAVLCKTHLGKINHKTGCCVRR
jgi:integrase